MPPDTPLILAFDTSAAHCAAALVQGDSVLAHRNEPMLKGQAERLMPMLEEIMSGADRSWSDLDSIAVGIGPGNFTGVRISVAAARSLSLALDIPAIGVSMFEALAYGTKGAAAILLDARRERVFWQRFQDGTPASAPEQSDIDALTPADFAKETVLYGHQADVLANRMGFAFRPLADFQPQTLAFVAGSKKPDKRPAPIYLRPADAALPSDPPPLILDDA